MGGVQPLSSPTLSRQTQTTSMARRACCPDDVATQVFDRSTALQLAGLLEDSDVAMADAIIGGDELRPSTRSHRKRRTDDDASGSGPMEGANLLAQLILAGQQKTSSWTWKRKVTTGAVDGLDENCPATGSDKPIRNDEPTRPTLIDSNGAPKRMRASVKASSDRRTPTPMVYKGQGGKVPGQERRNNARLPPIDTSAMSGVNPTPTLHSVAHLMRSSVIAAGGGARKALKPVLLPDPEGLVMSAATTTSISVRWEGGSQNVLPTSAMLRWAVECSPQSAVEGSLHILQDAPRKRRTAPGSKPLGFSCFVPHTSQEVTIGDLSPSKCYTVRVRLEQLNGMALVSSSAWAQMDCSTLEITAVPAAPLRPVVHRVSPKSAQVTILQAPCCTDGKNYACAEAYVIQKMVGDANEAFGPSWETITSIGCSCNHPTTPEVVGVLDKVEIEVEVDKTFRFRARAMNSLDNSPWSDIAYMLPPPAAPQVRVEQVTAERAHLVWNTPPSYGFDVQHYHVYVRRVGCDDEPAKEAVVLATKQDEESSDGAAVSPEGSSGRRGSLNKLDSWGGDHIKAAAVGSLLSGENRMHYFAHNLLPNTKYEVLVRAKSEGGLSDLSAPVEVETLPLPPPIPSNMCLSDIQPTLLTLTWSLESGTEGGRHGDDVSYQVCWRNASHDGEEHWSSQDVPIMTCTIEGLAADTLYAVKVRGCNKGGNGAWSPVWAQRTQVHPPRMPMGLHVAGATPTSMQVSWDSAHDSVHHPVMLYQLRVAARYHNGDYDPNEPWVTVAATETSESPRLTKVVEDLEPGVTYCVQLRAVNSYGPGEITAPLAVSTVCDVPPPPSQPVSESTGPGVVFLTWNQPVFGSDLIHREGNMIEGYMVQMRIHGQDDWKVVHEETSETRCVVEDVSHSTIYCFRVKARNHLGWSEWSDEGMEATPAPPPPRPPDSVVCVTTHNSATLRWWSQPGVTLYEIHQLMDGCWVSSMHARSVIAEQMSEAPAPSSRQISIASAASTMALSVGSTALSRMSSFDVLRDSSRKGTGRREPMMLTYTKDFLESNTEYSFRVVAIHAGGQSFSPEIRATTKEMAWAQMLTGSERGALRDLLIRCEASECFESLDKALHDIETLSCLSPSKLASVFDILRIPPKQQERLFRAICSPPRAPSPPLLSSVLFDSITIAWDEPSIPHGFARYPVSGFVVRMRPCGEDCKKESGSEGWIEVQSVSAKCTFDGLEPGTSYTFQVAAVNEPCGVGAWSPEAVFTTESAVCEDAELIESVTGILNTRRYAAHVCAILFHDEWTLDALRSLKPSKLEGILRKLKIKEGAVRNLCIGLAPRDDNMCCD